MELSKKDLDFLEEAGGRLGLEVPDVSLTGVSPLICPDESIIRELWEVAGDDIAQATAQLACPMTQLLAAVGLSPDTIKEFAQYRDVLLMYGIAVGLKLGKLNDYS